jgi:hypothetical protein
MRDVRYSTPNIFHGKYFHLNQLHILGIRNMVQWGCLRKAFKGKMGLEKKFLTVRNAAEFLYLIQCF